MSRSTLREFWEEHPDAEQPLLAWYHEAVRAEWRTPAEVKAVFGNASIIANDRIVFNIKGNDYRLVVHMRYQLQKVYVRFIGSHAEYDKIDAAEV